MKSEMFEKKHKNKGFTLIELLVGVVIFSIISGAAGGVLISSIQAQRKSLAYQQLLSQTSYLMEYMSRSLRMAKKDMDGGCIENRLNYQTTRSEKGIKFKNYQDICQEFFFEGGQIKENKNDNILPLTSAGLEVQQFNISLSGETQKDDLQPRVTVFLDIKGKDETRIKIQTTISQRNIDIKK